MFRGTWNFHQDMIQKQRVAPLIGSCAGALESNKEQSPGGIESVGRVVAFFLFDPH
jgi:hypothetical protein